MLPQEFLLAVMLTVFLPLALTRMILKYKENKNKNQKVAAGDQGSLTTGELGDLIRESVEDAILPLADRLSAVERKLGQSNTGAARRPLLDMEDETDMGPEAEPKEQAKTVGRLRSLS